MKTSPKNITLFHLCYFAIISTRSTFTKIANYLGTRLVGVAYKLKKKIKNSLSSVDVLHKTLNVVILRCCFSEDGKEMYQNVKRTCRVLVFSSLNLLFFGVFVAVALWLLKLLNDVVAKKIRSIDEKYNGNIT